jgi:hypothetical protein
MLVQPIPLWNNFQLNTYEYLLLKGYQGIFLVWIVPMAFVGLVIAVRRAIAGGVTAPVPCFVALYAVVTLIIVAATSLETRHHGQFLPAILILAALPDKNDPIIRRKIHIATIGWFGFVIVGHIAWAILKFF